MDETATGAQEHETGPRRGIRIERGITQYVDGEGVERFAVRVKHRQKVYVKQGFSTITKAQKWRESRKGRIAEGRLFPEQEAAARAAGPTFTICAAEWLKTGRGDGSNRRWRGIGVS